MADGYRSIGAGMSFLFPLQGHSAPTDLAKRAISRLSPLPQVAWRDCVPRYQVPVFPGERSWKFQNTRLPSSSVPAKD